jgi:hypothetical protein
MKKIKNILLLLILIVFSFSCKKGYLDINQNPNAPTSTSITPQLILPRAEHAVAARMAGGYDFCARWIGYWARSGTYGPSTEEESYTLTNNFGSGQWDGWYDVLFDLNTMEKKANAGGLKYYEAMAKVLKTVGFMYLVDMYDNVPYSKAFDVSGNILPGYDNGQAIYNSLFGELDNALVLFNSSTAAANPDLSTTDIMFKGDIVMWKKLLNTQRLKLIVRQSQISGFNASTQIAKVSSEGYLTAGLTAKVNPGYVVDNGKQNPYWDLYKLKFNGVTADDYNRANNYILNILKNSNDIRYQYYFDQAANPTNGTYYGYDYGTVAATPFAANSSAVGGPGLAKTAIQSQWLFTSVESLFLQAEAIQRGWITGNAQTAYENAIIESFNYLGIPNATIVANNYIANGNAIVNWTAATDKIKLIATQKYLALCGTNNFEAWVDYRRLGVPNVPLSLSPSRGSNVIPLRFRYPQSEYNYNAASVGAQGNPSPQTATVFWDK